MDYFILTARHKVTGPDKQEYNTLVYYCAQNITRNVYAATGSDKTTFLCSNMLTVIDTKDVVCITPSTPCGTIEVK